MSRRRRPRPLALAQAAAATRAAALGRDYTLAYERDIQPILDRYCGTCHQGQGEGRTQYDLTLRAGAGIFREPYVTLVLGKLDNPLSFVWPPVGGPGGLAGTLIPVAMPPDTMLKTVPPMTALSYKSPLIELAMSGKHYDVKLDALSLQTLMAWIDLLCPYRGEPEIRAMPDPDPAPFIADSGRSCRACGPLRSSNANTCRTIIPARRIGCGRTQSGNFLPPVVFQHGRRVEEP